MVCPAVSPTGRRRQLQPITLLRGAKRRLVLSGLEELGRLDSRLVEREPVATGSRGPEVVRPLAHDPGEWSGLGEAFEGWPDGVGALSEGGGDGAGGLASVAGDVGEDLGLEGFLVGGLDVAEADFECSGSKKAGVRRNPATLLPVASTQSFVSSLLSAAR